jgi:hypothetical protein
MIMLASTQETFSIALRRIASVQTRLSCSAPASREYFREMRARWGCFAASLAVWASGCSGCAPEFETTFVEPGTFFGLSSMETPEGTFAVALSGPAGEPNRLVVVDSEGERCSLDGVAHYQRMSASNGAAYVIAIGPPSADGVVRVRAVDLDCASLVPEFEALAPVFAYSRTQKTPGGFDWADDSMVYSAGGDVFVIKPWAGSVVQVGFAATDMQFAFDDLLCFVEGGSLVIRDRDGAELRRLGEAVSGLGVMFPDLGTTLQSELLLVEGGDLFRLESVEAEPELIAEDACEPGFAPGGISYLSPCATRRLVAHDLTAGTVSVIAEGVGTGSFSLDWFFYTKGTSPTWQGEVWAVPPGGEPLRWADSADLFDMRSDTELGQSRFLILDDPSGGQGQLTSLRSPGEVSTIRSNVESFYAHPQGLLALADLHDGVGTLYWWADGEAAPLVIASGVPPEGYHAALWAPAVGFLRDSVGGAGHLAVRWLETTDVVDVAEGVTEFTEIRRVEPWRWRPDRPGVAYVVGEEPDAGIWFATVNLGPP